MVWKFSHHHHSQNRLSGSSTRGPFTPTAWSCGMFRVNRLVTSGRFFRQFYTQWGCRGMTTWVVVRIHELPLGCKGVSQQRIYVLKNDIKKNVQGNLSQNVARDLVELQIDPQMFEIPCSLPTKTNETPKTWRRNTSGMSWQSKIRLIFQEKQIGAIVVRANPSILVAVLWVGRAYNLN